MLRSRTISFDPCNLSSCNTGRPWSSLEIGFVSCSMVGQPGFRRLRLKSSIVRALYSWFSFKVLLHVSNVCLLLRAVLCSKFVLHSLKRSGAKVWFLFKRCLLLLLYRPLLLTDHSSLRVFFTFELTTSRCLYAWLDLSGSSRPLPIVP